VFDGARSVPRPRRDPGHPRMGDYKQPIVRHGLGNRTTSTRDREAYNPVQSQTYEVTFLGQAGTALRSEFEDCEVTLGPGTTTLRAELPDRGALSGLIERINSLGLDVIDVSLVAPPGR
jgi:hypothetical protein